MYSSRSLRPRASQETFISDFSVTSSAVSSLLELDPTPMDSPMLSASPDRELPSLPEEESLSMSDSTHSLRSNPGTTSPPTNSTTLGLSGGGGHSAIYYLTRIQKYSSYTFTLFTTLHIATTSIIPLAARSVASSESYLLLAREIYQTPLSEPLFVALPVVAHVGSGIALRLLRRKYNLRRYGQQVEKGKPPSVLKSGWPTLSYIAASGYGFAAIFAAHVFMNRGLPLLVEGDSANVGLAYVSHGFAKHPVISWVSFTALLGLGCGHMVWGWAKWWGLSQGAGWQLERHTGNAVVDKANKKKRRRKLLVINGVSLVAALVWTAGGLGVVARGGPTLGWVGKLYDGLYEKVPFMA